jgi:Flp pilus assembly protein CpaB
MAAAAIVLALVAGIGVYMYASGADKRAEDKASFVSAYVANADIAKGTTGDEMVQAGLVTQEKVAKGSIPPGIVTDLNQLAGQVTAGPISTKQFLTAENFVSATDGLGSAFANSIKSQDLVAVTVTVDANRGVANQIAPGDHVNIAAKPVDSGDPNAAQYVYMLEHVKVLAVGSSTAAPQNAVAAGADAAVGNAPPAGSGVLTFEVTRDQALQVINANSTGGIYLVLLPPDSSGTSGTPSGAAKAAASK